MKLLLGFLLSLFVGSGMLTYNSAITTAPQTKSANETPYWLGAYQLDATTKEDGSFSIPHKIKLRKHSDGDEIMGVIISIKDKNGTWYQTDTRWGQENICTWNDTHISGKISNLNSGTNKNKKPVRILVFTRFVVG